ncbi:MULTISPECIES: helix-turn-helix domain-containing protein [Azospirillum]|jgi:predicted HTH transcriptional regulator|uniref:ATP-binding protein n=1 Tax=Azospirillum brasilense TaxID=192 RepID=A0ABU4P9Q0_AZOBR|nr:MULTISPECIES: ATP-binding protein [Azospirillum]MDW7555582.1 ATP-binding protein [Azospirillum brasilense]MDW7595509.1 ATP-binding protein [Azospirillum brasilense]MDW7630514.1 ATP-binding protein [Azospirillum brasilense]MDX5954290.1 ATP-binding protein [Azospirillum brasilense]
MFEERIPDGRELQKILDADEDHFFDTKGCKIQPAKLQETFVAFANADGGEIYVGVEDKNFKEIVSSHFLQKRKPTHFWRRFSNKQFLLLRM